MPEWARFQKWVANELRKVGFTANVRSQGSKGGFGVPDVDCHPFHIECKSYEESHPNIPAAIMQAKVDSCGNPEKYPIAITKYKEEKPIVSMYFNDFLNLIKEWKDGGRI